MPEDEILPYNFKKLKEAEHCDEKCIIMITIIIQIIQKQQK